MISIILAAIVGIVVLGFVFVMFADYNPEFIDYFMGVLMGLVMGFVSGALMFGTVLGLGNWLLDQDNHFEKVGLVAIRDGSSLTGAFVWGSGEIGPTGKYSFYYQDGAAKRLVSVDSSGIGLYEDSKDAYAVIYTGCDLNPDWVAPCMDNGPHFTEIHVPPGTVKAQTSLALNP